MTFGTFANGQRGAQFVHPNHPFSAHFQWKNAVDSKTIESDALIELDEIELAEVAGGTSNPSRPAPPPAPPIPIPYPNFTNTF
jgi:hypothetical protein